MEALDDVARFFDEFAADYHLLYGGGWDRSVRRQARMVGALIQSRVPGVQSILDCACGIGTQAIGLALAGYAVTATDLSVGAIERARYEAQRLRADLTFSVADFRDLSGIEGQFDAVIACDDALPHLFDPRDLQLALGEMRSKLRDGGLLLATMRNFDKALATKPAFAWPILTPGPPRQVLVTFHEWSVTEPWYTVRHIVLTHNDSWEVREHVTRLRAITRAEVEVAAAAAGFEDVTWDEDPGAVETYQTMTARASLAQSTFAR